MSHDAAPVRLLLVDDDEAITGGLAPLLSREGFAVTVAADGAAALDRLAAGGTDIVVLDVMMPGLDGREVLRRVRASGSAVPVVLLTSVGEASERARALDEGADDYLNKPFDAGELVSRVRAVLRRSRPGRPTLASASTLTAGPLTWDRVGRRAHLAGRELVVTPKALALLDYLMTHPDELLTRQRLLEVVWGFDDLIGTRAVDHRIAELRRVLGEDAASPRWIQTVPGSGYRFVADVADGR
ncbi:response regulator transcription factor [Propioniciclava coleopterorum]|uniref:Response regulator transcription factor n=1 Tax=Propioniciclava coleopterorum TaxID=2714937 RepID=A0A6G7Y4I7_9ACTN|nr:response regulator transcription factor [Propioniciclava coleopterorum]QIK71732.1 response regulator transcription factor [Propioniciclava coleopterorum]